mmetsp:Transcript_8182/g.24704  ORF Transcript_8182/g.24704 Transcript_8182/m.24704 type:complete len:204 (-) Transcript_8182:141-752(-)
MAHGQQRSAHGQHMGSMGRHMDSTGHHWPAHGQHMGSTGQCRPAPASTSQHMGSACAAHGHHMGSKWAAQHRRCMAGEIAALAGLCCALQAALPSSGEGRHVPCMCCSMPRRSARPHMHCGLTNVWSAHRVCVHACEAVKCVEHQRRRQEAARPCKMGGASSPEGWGQGQSCIEQSVYLVCLLGCNTRVQRSQGRDHSADIAV